MSKAVWNSILQQIQRVPSPENTQPWTFRYAHEKLEVFWAPQSGKHFFDTRDHAACLSLGGLLEYLDIAASTHHLQIQAEQVEPSFDGRIPALILSLQVRRSEASPLASALNLRHTNRTQFEPTELHATHLQMLKLISKDFPYLQLSFEKALSPSILEALAQLESEFWTYPEYLNDLLNNICFEQQDWERQRSGLFYKELGLASHELIPLLAAKKFPQIQKILPHLGVRHFVRTHNENLLRNSKMLIIGVREPNPDSLIDVGRAGMRVWLYLNQNQIAVHPMTALALQVFELNAGLLPGFIQGRHKDLLGKVSQLYQQELKMPYPVWVLRYGAANPKYKTCTSLRRPMIIEEPSYKARLVRNSSLEMSFPPNPDNTGVTI